MARGGSGNVYLSRRQPEAITDAGCEGAIDCALAGFADHLILIAWLVLLVVIAIGSLVFLPKARKLCDRERQRTRAEYEAFDRFLSRARNMSPNSGGAARPMNGNASLLQQTVGSANDLATLREAYEETVMAVSHFEEEYDETVIEHMRKELSDEIAEAVRSESSLSDPLYRSILDAASAARDRRKEFLAMLEEEAESLAHRQAELEEISTAVEDITQPLCADQSFDALQEQRDELEAYERRIEELVNDRQADRTAGRVGAVRSGKSLDLQAYLYRPMEPTYPVVAEATNLLSRITVTLRRVEDELIYRG